MRFAPIGIIVRAVVVPTTKPVRLKSPNISGAWIFDAAHSQRTSPRWMAVPKPEGAVHPIGIDDDVVLSIGAPRVSDFTCAKRSGRALGRWKRK